MEYYDIVRRFEKRFGFTELPETAIVGFNNARQSSTESLHDWVDRIVSLATEAFRTCPRTTCGHKRFFAFAMDVRIKRLVK
jgi:hypothetical protein